MNIDPILVATDVSWAALVLISAFGSKLMTLSGSILLATVFVTVPAACWEAKMVPHTIMSCAPQTGSARPCPPNRKALSVPLEQYLKSIRPAAAAGDLRKNVNRKLWPMTYEMATSARHHQGSFEHVSRWR